MRRWGRVGPAVVALVLCGGLAEAAESAGTLQAPQSPRLRALAADPGSVATFWQEIEKVGTPLIEASGGEPAEYWVTFVWRARPETRHVVVFGFQGGLELADNELQPLDGTDVLYRTYRRRGDYRGSYQMADLDSLERPDTDDSEAMAAFSAKLAADPFNREPWGAKRSLAVLPDAPPQPWIASRDDVPAGELIEHEGFHSSVLDNERTVKVHLPAGYDATGDPYPLVLLFDAAPYTSLVPTPTIVDNLVAAGEMPPSVVVLVGNAEGARNEELPCSEPFAAFLALELVPWVQRTYNVARDPSRTVVGGSSYGGLAASWFALRHPEIVGNVLSQSGSYWWAPGFSFAKPVPEVEGEWLTREYARVPRRPLRFYMDVGYHEGGNPSMLVVNRHFRDVLLAKGYEIARYQELNGGHDYVIWRGTLAEGLIALLGGEATPPGR